MGLNGIDISSWQDDLVVSAMGTCDFVIVKATGGAGYSNECFRRHADETLAAGKLLGCYHYARDRGYEGSAEAEADHFIAAFRPYVGKAIPFLDWEADALSLGPSWAKRWLDRVKAKTGVTPGIYTSKSVLFSYDWAAVAKTYPLWVAQYPNYEETGFLSEPWTDGWDFGAWSSPLIFQYTGTGRIPGYGGHLDLDLFYGTKDDWRRLCAIAGASAGTGEVKEVSISRANVAAQIMEHLCNCAEHGYSQPGRHGTSGHCSVKTDAGVVKVTKGDRDCSSAVCEAWELALAGTTYDGLITRYNWTGGMREMFVGSGLFSWQAVTANAQRGDIYLDEENHTAMALGGGKIGHFTGSETGGIDGAPGDQTGRESRIQDYYRGSWDGVLHYNGKADVGGASTPTGSGAPSGDVSELAARVIAGEFGNGDARKAALGDRYDEVQAEVNRILLGGSSGGSYDIDALARRVIAGEFGNGDERKRRLGDKYSAVQQRVNEILGATGASSTSMDVDAMARAVIRGDYGNGEERKRRLGSYYSIVQRRVNEMLS
ncbi:GH25 family lysozyme [Olsenella profusa]|uniref:Glycoside hydrolase, family 25 n=1 Tax=Olsenella profusa F0195 TaxID=1125712 RepID=U2TVW8_9ACTN|nr:GH25 family lysozyme [Olsenella profusa]ERL10198.1 glycoside hydrolase, family 25 [Olsenella profusa F0195]